MNTISKLAAKMSADTRKINYANTKTSAWDEERIMASYERY